nr:class F sortase [Actinopolymorpha cephalotaxi]
MWSCSASGGQSRTSADAAGQVATGTPSPDAARPAGAPGVRATRPAAVPEAAATARVAPVRVRAAPVGVDARVVRVGVDDRTGEMEIPRTPGKVGWYEFGPGLESPTGAVVIGGHVDTLRGGAGPFARLGELRPGARVTIVGADDRSRTFEVTDREEFVKTDLPVERIFARTGPPVLRLITCAQFDPVARHYRGNVVLTTVEVRR